MLDVELATQRAEIKFVPRLDYMEMSQRMTATVGEDGQRKKQTKRIAGVKPPARCPNLVNRRFAYRHHNAISLGSFLHRPSAGHAVLCAVPALHSLHAGHLSDMDACCRKKHVHLHISSKAYVT